MVRHTENTTESLLVLFDEGNSSLQDTHGDQDALGTLNYKHRTNSVISVNLRGMKNPPHSLFSIHEYHWSNTTLTTYAVLGNHLSTRSLQYVLYTEWCEQTCLPMCGICKMA